MNDARLLHLHPNLEMIAEELTRKNVQCHLKGQENGRHYRGVRCYDGRQPQNDLLYILRQKDGSGFPVNEYAYISTFPLSGNAPHLFCPQAQEEEILFLLLELLTRYQELELRIDDLVYRNAGLHELCELGAEMLGNPICIHDDWFIMIAMSQELPQVMQPDYIMSSTRMFIPRTVIEDFKYDTDYTETYAHRSAQLWQSTPDSGKCLYVNLWVRDVYQGRLLVVQHHRDFRSADYMLAEYLTQRAGLLMQRRKFGSEDPYVSMDDVMYGILHGKKTDLKDISQLMHLLGWSKNDDLICVRIKSQQPDTISVMTHVLHSDLFQAFPNSYIMFDGHQQCVILNVTRENQRSPQIRHILSPICRDYCLYAGISSPVHGVKELHLAYHQAGEALEHAFRLRNDKWIIPFSDCALDYMIRSVQTPLPLLHLVSPELRFLMDLDKEKGTQYFETLRTFLLLERDIPRTSEALIVHRTTLLYRLKKIHAMTELDLNDPQHRLYLLMSLRILELEKPISKKPSE